MLLAFGLMLSACTTQQILVEDRTVSCNLSDHGKNAVIYQNTSAEVHLLFKQAYALAKIKLDANLAEQQEKPVAVVLDVDETVLDNSRYELERIAEGKTYTPESWAAWVERKEATAIPGSKEFISYAKSKGCSIFYITNRAQAEEEATVENLVQLGYPDADGEHVLTKSATSDKTSRRYTVLKSHDVLLYVGDQLTDYKQLFKDRTENYGKTLVDNNYKDLDKYFVLTPNAVYGTWKDAISGKGSSDEKMNFVNGWFSKFKRK